MIQAGIVRLAKGLGEHPWRRATLRSYSDCWWLEEGQPQERLGRGNIFAWHINSVNCCQNQSLCRVPSLAPHALRGRHLLPFDFVEKLNLCDDVLCGHEVDSPIGVASRSYFGFKAAREGLPKATSETMLGSQIGTRYPHQCRPTTFRPGSRAQEVVVRCAREISSTLNGGRQEHVMPPFVAGSSSALVETLRRLHRSEDCLASPTGGAL